MSRKTCDNIDLVAYLHHRLPPKDVLSVDHHLNNCAECRTELAELSAVMSAMTDALPIIDAPPGLRDRVLATAYKNRFPKYWGMEAESQGDTTLPGEDITSRDVKHKGTSEHIDTSKRKEANQHEGFGSTRPGRLRPSSLLIRWLVAGLIVSAASSAVLANQLVNARQQLSQVRQQLSSSPKTVSLHAMPSAKDAAGKAVFVQVNHQLRLILYAANLKPTSGTQVYHIWLWNRGKRSSAGVMTVGSTGVGQFQGTLKSGHLDGIGITLEPNPNTSVPVGPKILGIKNIKIS